MDVQAVNERVIAQFRGAGGVEGMTRRRLLLLTTTGRRSGRRHTSPMMFHRDGERLLVVASNIGAPAHPDWYLNLLAQPHVTVEIGHERHSALALTLTGDDRARTWTMLKATYPFFADHEAATTRVIPVVALSPP